MSIQIQVNTETLSAEEARSLAIFFLELRGIPRDGLVAGEPDDTSAAVAESFEQSPRAEGAEGPVAQVGEGQTNSKRRGPGRPSSKVEKVSPVFILENKARNAQIQCDAGRKGEVEAAKGHLETWIRDAASPEEVAQLATVNAEFCATCLTKGERLAFSKLVAEVTESFNKAPGEEAAAPEGEAVTYTLDAVKAAGKALASAKGLPAVETVLAKFDSKVFRDIKEKDYAAAVQAFNEALS
jgi:hypothetical protein